MKKTRVTDSGDFAGYLEHLYACKKACNWVGGRSLWEAWAECHRGDWMLWLARVSDVDQLVLARATCACARLALPYTSLTETGEAIDAVDAWRNGGSVDAVISAKDSLLSIFNGAPRTSDDDAIRAALIACCTIHPIGVNDLVVTYASMAAARAGGGLSPRAYIDTQARCADLVRSCIPFGAIKSAIDVQTW